MTAPDLAGLLTGTPKESSGGYFTLHESAAGLGRFRYVEMGFFERVGRRAALLEPAPVALWAEAASLAASWRACMISELLPVSVGLPTAAELTRSAGAAVDAALDQLGPPSDRREADDDPGHSGQDGLGAAGESLDGLGLVGFVAMSFYPALLTAYERRQAASSPAADGPLRRLLVRVVADLEAELKSATDIAETPCRPA